MIWLIWLRGRWKWIWEGLNGRGSWRALSGPLYWDRGATSDGVINLQRLFALMPICFELCRTAPSSHLTLKIQSCAKENLSVDHVKEMDWCWLLLLCLKLPLHTAVYLGSWSIMLVGKCGILPLQECYIRNETWAGLIFNFLSPHCSRCLLIPLITANGPLGGNSQKKAVRGKRIQTGEPEPNPSDCSSFTQISVS